MGVHLLDFRRALPILQLAAVEVAFLAVEPRLDVQPAEEYVAAGLHQPLADDDPLAVVLELTRSEELLEHRRLGLLHLQEQRVLAVAAQQQRDPGARADAAHTDDLACEVGQAELLEQYAPVVLQCGRGRSATARADRRTFPRVRRPARGLQSGRSAAVRRRYALRRPRRASVWRRPTCCPWYGPWRASSRSA